MVGNDEVALKPKPVTTENTHMFSTLFGTVVQTLDSLNYFFTEKVREYYML